MKSLLFIFEISSFHFETPQELFLNNYESPQYENETKRMQNIKVETTETHDLRFWQTLSMETKLPKAEFKRILDNLGANFMKYSMTVFLCLDENS